MSIPFEAAALSIAFGASVSVLVQGRLLDRQDARDLPPRIGFALQAFDVWLAVVFLLIVVIVAATVLHASEHDRGLSAGDRHAVGHLLALAAVYPAMVAIGRRMLPILFAPDVDSQEAPARLLLPVLLMPLLALLAAPFVISGLVDPGISLSAELLRIVLVGLVVVGPCLALPFVVSWRSRRLMRRVRARARERRLLPQTVQGTLPDGGRDISANVFVGSIDDRDTCWLDTREVDRLVRLLADARRAALRRGDDPASRERWYWSGGFRPRLTVRYDGRFGRSDRGWTCPRDEPFVDGAELLAVLGARTPLRREW